MRALLLMLIIGCGKSDPAPQPDENKPRELLKPTELQRADEACTGYVKKVCACAETMPALKEECALSKAMPEAIEVAKRLAANPKADQEDSVQAAGSVRKTVRACIEKTAKLPEQGCP
jgi:hypothetical protein